MRALRYVHPVSRIASGVRYNRLPPAFIEVAHRQVPLKRAIQVADYPAERGRVDR
jgi:hypothetical protein